MTTNGPLAGSRRQLAASAQAPAINGSPLEQRINQERTLRYVTQELPLLLIAVSGHHDTRDKFGEAG